MIFTSKKTTSLWHYMYWY